MTAGGKTTITDAVFVEIARIAMNQVEDIYREERKGALSGLTRIFTGRFSPQITVKRTEAPEGEAGLGSVVYELKLTVAYGVNIPEVARKVREKVASEVEDMTGYKVERVDIIVDKLVKGEDMEPEEKGEQSL